MKLLTILTLSISAIFAEEANLEEFKSSSNQFAASVYKELLKKENDNFIVSPFSAEIILSLTQSGCKNETGEEIRNVLHLPGDNTAIESTFKAILPEITSNEYTLNTANKVYVKENCSVREEFKQAAEVYRAESENIDFTKKEDAAKSMNEWVEKQTSHKIKDLIKSNDLINTTAVLISALYFKANWKTTFPPVLTKKAKFHKNAKEVLEVDTMYLDEEHLLYYECPHLDAKLLEVPFEGDASMTIILPNEKEGLPSLENKTAWAFTPHNLTKELVNVALPKFKIETEIDFREVLRHLGVSKAFDEGEADLSGIAGDKGDLVIGKIVQKACVDVNEQGVEAAAATYVPVIVNEMGNPDVPKVFIADHPFIFYIKVKGLILFAGRVVVPTQ